MQNSTITLIVAIVGITGTLGGVVLGQWMSRSWQREQWLLDNRKEEYRELLSAVSNAYMHLIRRFDSDLELAPELLRAIEDAKVESFRVFRDRIFIAEELEWADMLAAWDTAVLNFEKAADPEGRTFAARFTQISNTLVQMATRPNRKRPLSRFTIKRILHKF